MEHRWIICCNIGQMGDPAKVNDKIGTVYFVSFCGLCAVVKIAGKTNMMLTLPGKLRVTQR